MGFTALHSEARRPMRDETIGDRKAMNSSSLDPIFRTKAAAEYLGVSRATLARWRRLGHFPQPARIGLAAIGWRQSVLDGFIRSREGGTNAAIA